MPKRPPDRLNRRTHEPGFSLVELLVALALSAILATAAFVVFFSSQRTTGLVTKVIENRQSSRTAIQLLERDLRMAGSGWGRLTVEGCYKGQPLEVPAIVPGYGGSDNASDTLGIMGGWDAVTTLRTGGMPNVTSTIKVVNSTGFSPGDFCVVTNGTSAHLFQITSINAPPYDMSHASTSPYNEAGGHLAWPIGGYLTGAKVYRVSWVSYRVDSTSARRPALVRWEQNELPQVVAYDVTQFKILYQMEGDTLTRDPQDLGSIQQLHPVVCMQVKGSSLVPIADSSWATVKPRSF